MKKISDEYFQKFKTKKYDYTGIFRRLKRRLINNYISEINKIINHLNPKNIIELGCGEGFVCGWLSQQYPVTKFTGLDINQQDLILLKTHFPQIETICWDLQNIASLPLANNKIDLILCLETLEHLKNPEKFLSQLGAMDWNNLIVSVPWEPFFQLSNFLRGENWRVFGNDPDHLHRWNNKQFIKLLPNNFIVQQNIISFPWQIFLLRKINSHPIFL